MEQGSALRLAYFDREVAVVTTAATEGHVDVDSPWELPRAELGRAGRAEHLSAVNDSQMLDRLGEVVDVVPQAATADAFRRSASPHLRRRDGRGGLAGVKLEAVGRRASSNKAPPMLSSPMPAPSWPGLEDEGG